MDARAWDERYTAEPTLWGAELNPVVAPFLRELTPGTAVDLACGNGRHAAWLADHGWRCTGVDFSPVAIGQARTRSSAASWQVGDALTWQPVEPLDLVLVAYLHLPPQDMRRVLRRCLSWLSPTGTLVHVGHARVNITHGVGGPKDPTLLPTVASIADNLDDGVLVRRLEHAERVTEYGTAIDLLLVAQRLRPQ
ncbi:MAG: methyltransferase domain-containing protein [Actinomycetota bacterium]|nr:methyltransferase domain-containing protein [Actinomycetota bacterium]